ncbi:hypothetical protein [Winogradskyella sp.]|uniref:hypothetical protein n=1 Tax=Winogradskyella sp. TaxID=1883156 RepID=UPI003AB35A7F
MSFTTCSSRVFGDLKAHQALVDLLSNGVDSIYPLLASADEKEKFITYHIKDNGVISKDSTKRYEVVVESYAADYDTCCEIADVVEEAFGTSSVAYQQLGGEPFQTEEGWLFIQQKFNIKI